MRKSIFDKIGKFATQAPLEDWWLMLQISKYAKMKFINEILYSYRWHNSNTIKDKEKMDKAGKMTKDYERHILTNINDSKVLSSVLKIKYGYLDKTIGIPYILTSEKYKCGILATANGGGGQAKGY